MEKRQKVKIMKLSDYEIGETLGTGNDKYVLNFIIVIHRFIWSC